MPHSTASPPGIVEATINYHFKPALGESPPSPVPGTVGAVRQKLNAQAVRITDIRSTDNRFHVHRHGFQLVRFTGPEGLKYETFDDGNKIKNKFYDEVKELLKTELGATYVFVISHRLRRESYQSVLDLPADTPDTQKFSQIVPTMNVHVDQSYDGAEMLVDMLQSQGGEATDLKAKTKSCRWAIINVWKPLKTVTREPLALCDSTTVSDAELRAVKLRAPPMEFFEVAHSPEHKWYWQSNMEPDEAFFIKCFDSKTEGVARNSPHSAFILPDGQGSPRESIEIRCVVCWENESN